MWLLCMVIFFIHLEHCSSNIASLLIFLTCNSFKVSMRWSPKSLPGVAQLHSVWVELSSTVTFLDCNMVQFSSYAFSCSAHSSITKYHCWIVMIQPDCTTWFYVLELIIIWCIMTLDGAFGKWLWFNPGNLLEWWREITTHIHTHTHSLNHVVCSPILVCQQEGHW